MSEILDSGERREFDSGAVRDIQAGKGRCDLLPYISLCVMFNVQGDKRLALMFQCLNNYVYSGNVDEIGRVLNIFCGVTHGLDTSDKSIYSGIADTLLEVAKHYEDGCNKYGERNWEKGIPVHCYLDSGVRHLLKHMRNDSDERHDRAFVWNMLGVIYTHLHHPELIDLPCKGVLDAQKRAREAEMQAQEEALQNENDVVMNSEVPEGLEELTPEE